MTFTFTSPSFRTYTGTMTLSALPSIPIWRHPHDRELTLPGVGAESPDRNYRGDASGYARDTKGAASIPEVYQLLPDHVTPLSVDGPLVDFVCEMNSGLPREKAMLIFDPHWAFNNGRTTPGYDKPRVCGGALLSGTVDGNLLQIDTLLTSDPVPSAAWVLARPWLWFYGVAVNSSGGTSYMTLGDGEGGRVPIKVPLITRLPVYVPLAWLHMLPAGYSRR